MNPNTIQPTPSTQRVKQMENQFQYPFWYIKGRTIFGAKKGTAVLSPGLIQVLDSQGQEVYRIATNPTIKLKKSLGVVQIKSINGQKARKAMSYRQAIFYFYNPALMLISFWFVFGGKNLATNFKQNVEHFANLQ